VHYSSQTYHTLHNPLYVHQLSSAWSAPDAIKRDSVPVPKFSKTFPGTWIFWICQVPEFFSRSTPVYTPIDQLNYQKDIRSYLYYPSQQTSKLHEWLTLLSRGGVGSTILPQTKFIARVCIHNEPPWVNYSTYRLMHIISLWSPPPPSSITYLKSETRPAGMNFPLLLNREPMIRSSTNETTKEEMSYLCRKERFPIVRADTYLKRRQRSWGRERQGLRHTHRQHQRHCWLRGKWHYRLKQTIRCASLFHKAMVQCKDQVSYPTFHIPNHAACKDKQTINVARVIRHSAIIIDRCCCC
jgi:hypothetical protein